MSRTSRCVMFALAALLIGVGAAARLAFLDRHVFTGDEAVSAKHISGYAERALVARLRDPHGMRLSDVARISVPANPNAYSDVVTVLAREDPQHPPLFYVAERWWSTVAGDSLAARRALPALFGLLGIAAAGFLCAVATRSSLGGAVGAALFAISPFEIVYAQEMREYSLWAALAAAATACMLLLVRRQTMPLVAAYAVALIAGLYTFPLFVLVLVAHVTMLPLLRATRRLYALAAAIMAAALVAWLPWLLILARQHAVVSGTNDWSGTRWSLTALAAKWLFNASTTFFDLDYIDIRWLPVAVVVLAIMSVAFAHLRSATREARAVTITTILWSFGVLAVLDVVVGGHRSTVARYATPAYCSVCLAVAAWVIAPARRPWERLGACAGVAVLCLAALSSIVGRAYHDAWWDSSRDGAVRPLAGAIDDARLPLLVTDRNWPILLQLAHYCKTNPRVQLVDAHRVDASITRTALVLTTSGRSLAFVRGDTALRARIVQVPGAQSAVIMSFRTRFETQQRGEEDNVETSNATLLVASRIVTAHRAGPSLHRLAEDR